MRRHGIIPLTLLGLLLGAGACDGEDGGGTGVPDAEEVAPEAEGDAEAGGSEAEEAREADGIAPEADAEADDGRLPRGAPCAADAECRSEYCRDLNGTGARCHVLCDRWEFTCPEDLTCTLGPEGYLCVDTPPGDGATGDACLQPADCQGLLCEEDFDGQWMCTEICPDHTCPDGFYCLHYDFTQKICLRAGIQPFGGMCGADEACAGGYCHFAVPGDLGTCSQTCTADGDCPPSWACRDAGDRRVCEPDGTGAQGTSCFVDAECATAFCRHRIMDQTAGQPGFCTTRCPDGACPAGYFCRFYDFDAYYYCHPLNPDGAALGEACVLDRDCAGFRCDQWMDGSRTCARVCPDGECPEGYACDENKEPARCKRVGYQAQSGACTEDAQCAAENPICEPVSGTQQGRCTRECAGAQDCPANHACADAVGRCRPDGRGTAGAACQDSAECADRLCFDGQCLAPCTDGTCADPASTFCRFHGGDGPQYFCTPIFGAGVASAACAAPADCRSGVCTAAAQGAQPTCLEYCPTGECPEPERTVCLETPSAGQVCFPRLSLGHVCSDDATCAPGLACHQPADADYRYCSQPCGPDAPCPAEPAGYDCPIDDGTGHCEAGATGALDAPCRHHLDCREICVADLTGTYCSTSCVDAPCPAGFVCAATDAQGLERFCFRQKGQGEPCYGNLECADGLSCTGIFGIPGICTVDCGPAGECPEGFRCDHEPDLAPRCRPEP